MMKTKRRRRRKKKRRRGDEEREDILEALKRQRERHRREDGRGEKLSKRRDIPGFTFDEETQRFFPSEEMIRRERKKKMENNIVIQFPAMTMKSKSITSSIMSRIHCKHELRTVARRLVCKRETSLDCVNMDVVRCNETGGKVSAIAQFNYSIRVLLSNFRGEESQHEIGIIETTRHADLPFLRFAGATGAFDLLAHCTDAHLGRTGRISIHYVSNRKLTQSVYDWNLHEMDGTFRAAAWCSQPHFQCQFSVGASATFHQSVNSLLNTRNVRAVDSYRLKSDTMCQEFTNDDSLLLTGCRNGSVR